MSKPVTKQEKRDWIKDRHKGYTVDEIVISSGRSKRTIIRHTAGHGGQLGLRKVSKWSGSSPSILNAALKEGFYDDVAQERHEGISDYICEHELEEGVGEYLVAPYLVNDPMRKGELNSLSKPLVNDLLDAMTPLKEAMVVYRGLDGEWFDNQKDIELKTGDTFVTNRFLSTSTRIINGFEFAAPNYRKPKKLETLIEFEIAKGVNVLITNPSQSEVIIAPGQKITITGLRKNVKVGDGLKRYYTAIMRPGKYKRPIVEKNDDDWLWT